MKTRSTTRTLTVLMALAACAGTEVAFAAAAAGGGLPWEAPLVLIVKSMTGPVAFGVSVIALVLGISTLAFSDQLSGAGRYMVYFVLIIAMLVAVVNLLQTLFGVGADGGGSLSTVQVGISATLVVLAVALAHVQLALFEYVARARARTTRREFAVL